MQLTQTLTLAIQTAPSFPAELLTFCILINCLMTKAKQDTKKEREPTPLRLIIVPCLTPELGCDSSPKVRQASNNILL